MSQAINSQTLADFTRWKYPNLPLNEKVHELLIGDLDHGRFVTLLDVNQAIEAAARAVKCYAKENPNVFTTATDFITKSLGFVDKNFREKHGFYKPTLDAFSKYEHLVELTRSPEMVQDHQVIYDRPKEADTEHASGREPGPLGTRFWWRVSGIVFIVILTAVMMRSSLFDRFLPGGDRPSEKQTPVPAPVGTPAPEPSRTTTSGPSWAPESLLDQRNDPPGGTGGMEITSNSTVAQSFTVGRDGQLVAVDAVDVRQHRCLPHKSLYMSVVQVDGDRLAPVTYATREFHPDEVSGSLHFALNGNGPRVHKGDQLAVMLESQAQPSGCTYGWGGTYESYPSGRAFINGSRNPRDMKFRTYVEPSAP